MASRLQILAISGSLRAASTNTTLLRAAASLAPPGIDVTIFDGLGDLPHFRPEMDVEGAEPAPSVARLRSALKQADAVIVCTPEYAFGMPGVLKNALDWTVSSGEFNGKPVAAISAGPGDGGGAGARAWLLTTLSAVDANVVEEASFAIPFVRTKLAGDGTLTDAGTADALRTALVALARAARREVG